MKAIIISTGSATDNERGQNFKDSLLHSYK